MQAAEADRTRAEAEAADAKRRVEELNTQVSQSGDDQHVMVSFITEESSGGNTLAALPEEDAPAAVVVEEVPEEPPEEEEAVFVVPASALPRYYQVRVWPPDCFWNIAELLYEDPFKWTVIYEANRAKLEDPDNPDKLEPGVILEIPSINGEHREGLYQ